MASRPADLDNPDKRLAGIGPLIYRLDSDCPSNVRGRYYILTQFSYNAAMTKLLEQAFEAVRKLSSEEQDEIARAMFQFVAEPEEINPAHLSVVLKGLAQMKSGAFASEEEVEAAFRRFDS